MGLRDALDPIVVNTNSLKRFPKSNPLTAPGAGFTKVKGRIEGRWPD
jgi:hypothetical protein